MSPFIFIALGLIFLGIGIYQLVSSKSERIQEPSVSEVKSGDFSNKKDYHKALEEAIEIALADGTLTQREKALLREKAKLAGKDPDELILQLREDLIGMEDSETEIINTNQRAGLNFEKYVVQKFSYKYYNVEQWAGDKFVAGRYAKTTLDPDIQLSLKKSGGTIPFAVECKWRNVREGDFIRFAEDHQLVRYQEFEKRTGKPTFIVLGVGGRPSAPAEVYVIPIGTFSKGNQHKDNLDRYRRKNADRDFYYDQEKGELR